MMMLARPGSYWFAPTTILTPAGALPADVPGSTSPACTTHENIGVPRHAPDVVIERDIAFDIDVLDVRSVVGEAVKPKRPVVEDDVVLQQQRGGRTLAVDPVRQVVGAAVVVHDGAVDFGPGGLRPDEDAVIRCVMDHQVDELRAGRVDVDAMQR